MFFEGSERKEAFLHHKKTSAQKTTQNFHFFKEVSPWFLSKNGDFLMFSFYAKWIKKKFFLRFRKKRSLFRAKEHRLKKPPKLAFF